MKISPEKLRRVSCLLKATWATWEKNNTKKNLIHFQHTSHIHVQYLLNPVYQTQSHPAGLEAG